MMRQMRHRALGAVVGASVILGVLAGPAGADPPPSSGIVQRFVITDGFGVIPDFQNGLWIFANITRQGFCDWLAGGEMGPPPVIDLTFLQAVDTGSAIVILFTAGVVPIALHPLTSGHPCDGSDPDAWATGEANLAVTDNDIDVSGTRTNAFGEHAEGEVEEVATGDVWHYSWHTRFVITQDGEFRIVSEVRTLRRLGT